MWIDVGKLIREHVPDKNGKTLPPDLTSGSYEFRDLTDKFIGSLFEGKVIYDKTYGHVTYGCANCSAYDYPWLNFDPLEIPLSFTAPNTVQTYDCNGRLVDVTSHFHGWTITDTSIATVDDGGIHTGVTIGSTTTSTSGYLLQPGTPHCPTLLVTPTGGDNVRAVPTNFRQVSATDKGGGTVEFKYQWDSTSGYLADLASCTVGEVVTYQGYATPQFNLPTPFPVGPFDNPTIINIAGNNTQLIDDQQLPQNQSFRTPYYANSFAGTQYYRYACPGINNGQYVNLLGPLTILRAVQPNSDGTWFFIVTKPTNGSVTINPLP
jgi:hypothetical protein